MARMRARPFLARATGRHAITVWTWAITAPFALTVMSGVQYVSSTRPYLATLSVAAVEHLGVGLLLLATWAILRVTPRRVRTWVVAVLFAGIGVARPFLFLASGALLGVPVAPGDLAGRVAINVVTSVVLFALIAVGVDLVREHLGVVGRLDAARLALDRDAEAAAERIRDLRRSSVDAVLRRIDRAAPALEADIDREEAAALLRSLADDVVRPVSHRLFAGTGDAAGGADSEQRPDHVQQPFRESGTVPPLPELAVELIRGMRPAPPVAMALLFGALVAPFAVSIYGPVVTAGQLLVGVPILILGNAAVAWAIVRVTRLALRLITLLAGYIAVGLLLTIESDLFLRALGLHPRLIGYQALLYPVIAVSVAFVASVAARLRADQSALEQSVQASLQSATRMRADYDHERAAIARLLHSGVQSELIAAALALRGDADADAAAVLREVFDRIGAELRAPVAQPDPSARIRSLVESWGSALTLDARIGDDIWERLGDPVRCAAVVDTISEGLANAVRHGDGGPVVLVVCPDSSNGVRVSVTSSGSLAPAHPGIGLRELAQRGDVELREVPDGVELAVAIP